MGWPGTHQVFAKKSSGKNILMFSNIFVFIVKHGTKIIITSGAWNFNTPDQHGFSDSSSCSSIFFSEPVQKLEGHTGAISSLVSGKFGTLLSGSWDK